MEAVVFLQIDDVPNGNIQIFCKILITYLLLVILIQVLIGITSIEPASSSSFQWYNEDTS